MKSRKRDRGRSESFDKVFGFKGILNLGISF